MAEHSASDDKKGYCGSGRCCWTAGVLVVLALMMLSGAVGYLMGKSCAMSGMDCMKKGACAHGGMGGMMSCPVTGGAPQEPAAKK